MPPLDQLSSLALGADGEAATRSGGGAAAGAGEGGGEGEGEVVVSWEPSKGPSLNVFASRHPTHASAPLVRPRVRRRPWPPGWRCCGGRQAPRRTLSSSNSPLPSLRTPQPSPQPWYPSSPPSTRAGHRHLPQPPVHPGPSSPLPAQPQPQAQVQSRGRGTDPPEAPLGGGCGCTPDLRYECPRGPGAGEPPLWHRGRHFCTVQTVQNSTDGTVLHGTDAAPSAGAPVGLRVQ